jgi:hypothetical protein
MWKYVTSFSIFSAGLETLHDYVKDCGHLAPHLTIFQFLVYHGCQFH